MKPHSPKLSHLNKNTAKKHTTHKHK